MDSILLSFFFFQAEDGIRDYKVTGVQTCALPIFRLQRHEVLAEILCRSCRDGVRRVPSQHLREGALPGPVRPHDGVHLAGAHREIHAAQDLVAVDPGVQVLDLEQDRARHPTLPSRLMPSSRCASTANSIGSSLKTSLQKPFTIMLIASSAARPRCLQ